MFIRLGVVHNIPSLNSPSHVIHKFLETLWKSQRQSVVQEFVSQFCETNVPVVDLDQLKALAQEIKVTYICTHRQTHTHMHACTLTYYSYDFHPYQGFKADKLDKALADETIDNIITSHMIYSHEVLMLREGQQAFLSNGRVSFI